MAESLSCSGYKFIHANDKVRYKTFRIEARKTTHISFAGLIS